ncbi:MAG: hypothetical protein K5978_08520 [Campylobacter sp.]|nr:hypothetical protein [Campylobacter sp.]
MIIPILANLAFCHGLNWYINRAYAKSGAFLVTGVQIVKSQKLANGFEAKFLKINIHINKPNKDIIKNDIVFEKDGILTTDLIDIKTKTSARDELLGEKIKVEFNKRTVSENDQNCN